ncbi:MAG: TolC family protein [Planctomycetaceae bacterium]
MTGHHVSLLWLLTALISGFSGCTSTGRCVDTCSAAPSPPCSLADVSPIAACPEDAGSDCFDDSAAQTGPPVRKTSFLTTAHQEEVSSLSPSLISGEMNEPEDSGGLPMDLATVLSMVGGQHPVIGFARWRVQEAYAEQTRAESLWLPSIQAGVSFHQHDGNLQASNGSIQDVNRSSLQAGLGTGAVGAGTTPNPGIVARFHLADAIFAPSIAEKNSWATSHAATAAMNDQLLAASQAWLDLLTAEQRIALLADSQERLVQLKKITQDFAEAGQGLHSDADRMAAEVSLCRSRVIAAEEQAEVARVRLVETVGASPGLRIVPAEHTLVPLQLVNISDDPALLIDQALHARPELQEAQCLVAAASERFQRQKYAPFVPSVLLGMSQTGFGGGQGTTGASFNNRMDLDAALTWELRGLGYGEHAARHSTAAQFEQARFQHVRRMDQVAREVGEAHAQARFRHQRISVAEQCIESAEASIHKNLDRIRNGQGLPIEALQATRALEDARMEYLLAVSEYNQAQFRLHRAIGLPVYAAH